MQQGDPLGPLLLVSPSIQCCLTMKSVFKMFYLDDGTIGGSVEEVVFDLKTVFLPEF